MMVKFPTLVVGGLICVAFCIGGAQADTAKLVKKCESCHGEGGNGDDLKVPNIAGMSEVYIHDTMMEYQEGDRAGVKYKPKDGEETDMAAIAKKMTEDDINAVAAHFAEQTYQPRAQKVDATLAKKGAKVFDKACEKCHSEGGTVADDDAGLLAGQGRPYLEEQMTMFTDGTREMPKKMAKKFKKLDDAEKAAVVEFMVRGPEK